MTVADAAILAALDHLLAAGWEVTMSQHPDRAREAPDPGAIVKVVRLRHGRRGITRYGRAPFLLEALRVATREGEKALQGEDS